MENLKQMTPREKYWNFLKNSDFEKSFKNVAWKAILWKNETECVVREYGFANVVIPEKYMLPENLHAIKPFAFYRSTLPVGFIVSNNSALDYDCFNSSIFLGDFKIPEKYSLIMNNTFKGSTFHGNLEIPLTKQTIGGGAFKKAVFKKELILPESISSIESWAFYGAIFCEDFKLNTNIFFSGVSHFHYSHFCKSFVISDNVKGSIWESGFEGVTFEEEFVASGYLNRIGNKMFKKTVFKKKFVIPWSVELIEEFGFSGATFFENFEIPDWVIVIKKFAFQGTKFLKQLVIPYKQNHAFLICENAFSGATLPNRINNNISTDQLYRAPWFYKGILGFNLPDNIHSIPSYAFEDTIIPEDFKIPKSVTTIDSYAFFRTTLHPKIKIPSSITSIEDDAFLYAILPESFKIPPKVDYNGIIGFSIPKNLKELTICSYDGIVKFPDNFHIPSSVKSLYFDLIGDVYFSSNFIIPKTVLEVSGLVSTSGVYIGGAEVTKVNPIHWDGNQDIA